MPVVVYKPLSRTPFEMVEKYKQLHPELASQKIGYAGRLDPMAEGLLLLLIGDENKEKQKFEGLEKEYRFQILFGIETDTYDVMGKFINPFTISHFSITIDDVRKAAEKLVGTFEQEYPPYSSVTVKGKPLYWWARKGRLNEITVPKKKITVKEAEVIEWRELATGELAQDAIQRIKNVSGDFRQEEIINQWWIVAKRQRKVKYPLADCRIVCSSGTYVRGLVHTLGRVLNTPALTYSITRTRIGMFTDTDIAHDGRAGRATAGQ